MGLLNFFNRKFTPKTLGSTRSIFTRSGGSFVTPDTSMQVSSFYSGVIYIATQIAKLPWEIKNKKNEIIESPVSKLLRLAPNPEMNSFMFRLFVIIQAIIHGNAYAEIERNVLGHPVALWPLPSENVIPCRIDGKLVYRVVGGDPEMQGQDAYLLPKDIFHIKNFYTKDGIVGQGVIAYASEVLGIALGSDKFANSLFANGGLPSGVLEVPGTLSEEGMKRIKESWQTAHSGRKIGGTAVLEEGVKFNPTSLDPNVLQFLETRKFSVIEIARFLRVPPSKLFSVESTKYSNVEQENLSVAVDTLDAWVRNIEMETDVKLLNKGYKGFRSELDIYSVFRGDMTTRSNYFAKMMQGASLTPNQVREKEGLPSYDGGDRYYIATNNFSPVDRVDEILDSQIKSKNLSAESDEKANSAVADYLERKK